MNALGTAGRLFVGAFVVALVGGCTAGATESPSAAPVATAIPSAAVATPTPRPTPSVVVTSNVAYESANPVLVPGVLDVYAPAKAGPWPVVVMFHAPGWEEDLGEHAHKVADLGFVVFAPIWGHMPGGAVGEPTHDGLMTIQSQAACAVAFARAHAAEYGGDPAMMIVFGHSGGANLGAMVAFARPEPTAGCHGGTTLGAIDALVTWEGDWLAMDPRFPWDDYLAADPRVMDGYTPWKYLAKHKDLKVVMLVSEHPGVERPLGDPWAADSWLAVRDPSGDLRRQLEASGVFADGIIDVVELQQLLSSVLEAQGNPVSLDVMPDSNHEYVGGGWEVFLAAFGKAAARD